MKIKNTLVRSKRIILVLTGVMISLGLLAIGWIKLKEVYLPERIKSFAEKNITAILNKTCTIEKVTIGFLGKLTLKNIRIVEPGNTDVFFAAEEAQATFLAPPLSKNQILLSSVSFKKPQIRIIRDEQGNWNFLPQRNLSQKETIPHFIIRAIAIENGIVAFSDQTCFFKTVFEQINAEAVMTLGLSTRLKIESPDLTVRGNVSSSEKEIKTNLQIIKFQHRDLVPLINGLLKNTSAQIINLSISGMELTISAKKQETTLSGKFLLTNLALLYEGFSARTSLEGAFSGLLQKSRFSFTFPISFHALRIQGKDKNYGYTVSTDLTGSTCLIDFTSEHLVIRPVFTAREFALSTNEFSMNSGGKITASAIFKKDQIPSITGEGELMATSLTGTLPSLKTSVAALDFAKGDLNFSSLPEMNTLTVQMSKFRTNFKTDVLALDLRGNGTITLFYNPNDRKTAYKTTATLTAGDAKGLPFGADTTEIQGTITATDQTLHANLQGTLYQSPLVLSLKAGKKTENWEFQAHANYASTLAIVEQMKIWDMPVQLRGNFTAEGDVTGTYGNSFKNILYQFTVALSSAQAKFKNNFSVAVPKSTITITPKKISWKDTIVSVFDENLSLEGTFENFATPHIQTNISSQKLATNLSVTGIVQPEEKTIEKLQIQGKILNSQIRLAGLLKNFQQPFVDCIGSGSLDSERITDFLRERKIMLMKCSGMLETMFTIKGNLFSTETLTAKASLLSKNLKISEFRISNVKGIAQLKNNEFTVSPLQAECYQGIVDIRGHHFLQGKTIATLTAQNISLKELQNDLPIKEKNYTGIITGKIVLTSPNIKDLNLLEGRGLIEIKDGKIWQLNLFKQLGAVIFTPEFKNLVFTEGASDFLIHDKKIDIRQLELNSEFVSLEGKGTIGFDGLLNLNLYPLVIESKMNETKDIRKFTSKLFGQGGLTLEVKGTLKEPKITVQSIITNPVKQIKNIFQDFFKPETDDSRK